MNTVTESYAVKKVFPHTLSNQLTEGLKASMSYKLLDEADIIGLIESR